MSKKRDINLGFHRNFLLFFMGQTVSQAGTAMTGFATVIWAYSTGGRVMASSLLAICGTIPYLLVSLFGGTAADRMNKKRILLFCDLIAALGTVAILASYLLRCLSLWVLCAVNVINGLMNAFQSPASQVAVTLLVDKKEYARVGGMQAAVGGLIGILQPVLAAALLRAGGLELILWVDLCTFAFAFVTVFLVKIPDDIESVAQPSFRALWNGLKEGMAFLKLHRSIMTLFVMYGVLEFAGAISFDGMFSPLLLARTHYDQRIVGIVSACMAAGSVTGGIAISVRKAEGKRLPVMYLGSYMCLAGITLFGMGRNPVWWCVVVYIGCFGAPVYHTCQTVLIREKVAASMQGRVFALQGMITQMLAPLGYFLGALLADYVFTPFMAGSGGTSKLLKVIVGSGEGSGIGLLFVAAGVSGILLLTVLRQSRLLRELE